MPNFSYYIEMSRQACSLQAVPKILNYIKYRCLKRKVLASVRRYSPQIAAVLLTVRCNLNCGYCFVARRHAGREENWAESEASFEKIQRIFANPLFGNCLMVDLLGGEPLLVKDLDRIIAFLRQRGHIINISTNGLLLLERIADLKRAGISRINVSLYDANRLVLERDLAKINRVFPVHTSLVLLRSQIEKQPDKLFETARFVHDLGCLSLRFFLYRPMGIKPQLEEIITDTHPAYLEFRKRLEDALPGFCFWPAALQTKTVKKLCPQLWQRIECDASGNMSICCGTDMRLRGVNSNLFDDGPDIVFNHPTLVKMRKQLLDPKLEPPEVCKTCNLLGDFGW